MSSTQGHQDPLREQIALWNRLYPVGTAVHSRVYPDCVHRTSSPATILFNRKAVIHLEGFSGYFDLNEIRPAEDVRAAPSKRVAVLFPGTGAQKRGMGEELFQMFPEQTRLVSGVLGCSIERVCLEDSDSLLDQLVYSQVAMYVVNAFGYWERLRVNPLWKPEFLIGHSVGEYNALLAADVFDFETGLRLVMNRGALMEKVPGGTMAAVLGARPERISEILACSGLNDVDLANYNTPTQTVIAGPVTAIERAVEVLAAQRIDSVPLRVSVAGHSRYMHDARRTFTEYVKEFTFSPPSITVIANATGRPYEHDRITDTLCAQMTSAVRWVDCVRYVLSQGEVEFVEVGGSFLSAMVSEIAASADQSSAHRSLASEASVA